MLLNFENNDMRPFRFSVQSLSDIAQEITIEQAQVYLSLEEKTRLQGIHDSHKKSEFIYSRVMLKKMLEAATGLDKDKIQIRVSHNGRPEFDVASKYDFNMSHSSNLCAVAVSETQRVGVDIERVDVQKPWYKLAQRYFAEEELRAHFSSQQDPRGAFLFFKFWSAKESLVKLIGGTLGQHIQKFQLDVGPLGDLTVIMAPNEWDPRDFNIHFFEPRPGFVSVVSTYPRSRLPLKD